MKRISIILIITVLCKALSFAQGKVIDSLKQVFNEKGSDRQRLDALYALSSANVNPDSLWPYLRQGETLIKKINTEKETNRFKAATAAYYIRKNNSDSALLFIEPLVHRYKNDRNEQAFYLELLFFRAKIYDRKGEYSQALTQLSEVIELAEELKDTLIQVQAKTGIGWVEMEMGQYKEALQWLYRALHTSSDKKYYANYGALYSNLASTYNSLGQTDSAKYYIDIAIQDARDHDNDLFLATALSMQAKILIDAGQTQLAEQPLHEVVLIRKKLNDPFYTAFDMSNLASYYAANKQPEKGIALCKEGITIVKEQGLSAQLLLLYQALAANYKAAGDDHLYGETLQYVIALKDSFNNINSAKQLAVMQANYETQKSERTIIEQKLSLTQKNYWLFGSAIFSVMAAIIAWLGFQTYRRRQQEKMKRALEEEKRLAAMAVTEAEEQERKRIAADLHDNLGVYAASMASNLSYVETHHSEAATTAVFEELRNNSNAIISQLNDTIWVLKKDQLSLTAISDRVKIFVHRIGKSYPGMNIEVQEDIDDDKILPSSQAFHLYRVIQEAIVNALKHSKGNSIAIRIGGHAHWQVEVADNGKGMSIEKAFAGGGNGLLNMQHRSREAGWQINWTINSNGGTSVWITPTTN